MKTPYHGRFLNEKGKFTKSEGRWKGSTLQGELMENDKSSETLCREVRPSTKKKKSGAVQGASASVSRHGPW